MSKKIIIAIVAGAVIIFGAYFLLWSPGMPALDSTTSPQSTQQGTSNQVSPSATAPITQETSSVEQNVVAYTDAGYSPDTLRLKTGETAIFKNQSSQPMWTASALHPTHAAYSGTVLGGHCPDAAGTAFDACTGIQPGNSWSFTFTKKGVWKYHNHLSPGDTGTIAVE